MAFGHGSQEAKGFGEVRSASPFNKHEAVSYYRRCSKSTSKQNDRHGAHTSAAGLGLWEPSLYK